MNKAKATAFGEEYDYCQTCKKELKELTSETKGVKQKAPDFKINTGLLPKSGVLKKYCEENGIEFKVIPFPADSGSLSPEKFQELIDRLNKIESGQGSTPGSNPPDDCF